jgi:hypothetical protein
MKRVIDFIYGVNRAKKAFAASHPGETILAADASKGIMTDGPKPIEKGASWVGAQRAVIILSDKRIKCGKWDIPLEEIVEATLVRLHTRISGGQVLKISTRGNRHFQFGMMSNKQWEEQNALPLSIEKGKVSYSLFSIIIRVLLVAFLAYYLYRQFK